MFSDIHTYGAMSSQTTDAYTLVLSEPKIVLDMSVCFGVRQSLCSGAELIERTMAMTRAKRIDVTTGGLRATILRERHCRDASRLSKRLPAGVCEP